MAGLGDRGGFAGAGVVAGVARVNVARLLCLLLAVAVLAGCGRSTVVRRDRDGRPVRSDEHTSELQSLMRTSYAVFCLQTKKTVHHNVHQDSSINDAYNAKDSDQLNLI